MGAALIARALGVLAILGPWIVWLPIVRGPIAVVLFGAIAIVAACHGWGRLVARVARCSEVGAVLTIWWGIAAMIALAGISIALHGYDARLLVIGGGIAHGLDLSSRFAATCDAIDGELRWHRLRYWILPAALIAVLALFNVLGGAGAANARPFDDDGHVIAQMHRLLDTGTLGDPLGYARSSQMGGHVALAGLVGAFADPSTARMIDGGVGFVLLLALAVARLRPRDAADALWGCLLIVAASAAAFHWHDFAPLWLAAGMIVAMYSTLQLAGGALPLALVAGAACALRTELAPVAIVLVAAGWWRSRRSWRDERRRIVALAAAFAFGVVPYAIARALAWGSVDHAARLLLVPAGEGWAVRAGLLALVTLALAPVLAVVVSELADRRARWLAVASAAGLAGIASQTFGERPFATHYMWPITIAGSVVIAIEVAGRRDLPRMALVAALLAFVLVADARETRGRLGWWARYEQLADDIAYLRNAAPQLSSYDRILAAVPRSDAIVVWVARPETLDYSRHRIFDLRTPRAARLRVPGPYDRRLEQLVFASHARWLLLETDDEFARRANESLLYRILCTRAFESCADSLEALAFRHHVVAEEAGVRLIALDR